MDGFSPIITAYLSSTKELMLELGIALRDTFSDTKNYDDFYSNGKKWDGDRLLSIDWIETDGMATASAKKKYNVPGLQAAAYDAYKIMSPMRFKHVKREDPVIHECVHFLQHTTLSEDNNYVPYNGNNYLAYIQQRAELEAHIVQILYITRASEEWLGSRMDSQNVKKLKESLDKFRSKPTNIALGVYIIGTCKKAGVV